MDALEAFEVLFHENNLLVTKTEKAKSLRGIPLGAGRRPLFAEMMNRGKSSEKMQPETTNETGKNIPPGERKKKTMGIIP